MGHFVAAWGVRVDGTSSRGLWPPVGGGLCIASLMGRKNVLKMDRPAGQEGS